jgi:O-antigen chain-terminating methyltransferase
MVQLCRERGLAAEVGDLFEALSRVEEGSLGGVVSFHVIEHLPPGALDRLVRLAYRALRPGGVLILETPNPLSVVVAARNFWLDPTHVRPVHPESLRLMYELAGFDPIERLDLRPFREADRLPEIDLARLPEDQRPLADQVNRLRDRLDDLLFGFQDFGMVGRKPAP